MGIRNAIRIMTKAVGFGVYPHQLSWLLHVPLRRIIMSPQKVANRLNLKKDYEVLEIGPGSGYFSVEVAHRLTKGHLQLYDIQQEMLENAKVRLQAQNLNNTVSLKEMEPNCHSKSNSLMLYSWLRY